MAAKLLAQLRPGGGIEGASVSSDSWCRDARLLPAVGSDGAQRGAETAALVPAMRGPECPSPTSCSVAVPAVAMPASAQPAHWLKRFRPDQHQQGPFTQQVSAPSWSDGGRLRRNPRFFRIGSGVSAWLAGCRRPRAPPSAHGVAVHRVCAASSRCRFRLPPACGCRRAGARGGSAPGPMVRLPISGHPSSGCRAPGRHSLALQATGGEPSRMATSWQRRERISIHSQGSHSLPLQRW